MPEDAGAEIYVAGAKLEEGRLLTSGGRVLGVTATAGDLKTAIGKAYSAADRISFKSSFCRRDIGQMALRAGKES
jgi:phosphoribosylamine--glycine ligase